MIENHMRYAEMLAAWTAQYLLVTAVAMSLVYGVARLASTKGPDGRRHKTPRKRAAIIAFAVWAGLHLLLSTRQPEYMRAGARAVDYIVAALLFGGWLWYSAHRKEASAAAMSSGWPGLAVALSPVAKRVLLFVGLALVLMLVESAAADCAFSLEYGLHCIGYGAVSRIFIAPVRAWTGLEWITVIGTVLAARYILRSTRPKTSETERSPEPPTSA